MQWIEEAGLVSAAEENPARMKAYLKSADVIIWLSSMFIMGRRWIVANREFVTVFPNACTSLKRNLSGFERAKAVDVKVGGQRKGQTENLENKARTANDSERKPAESHDRSTRSDKISKSTTAKSSAQSVTTHREKGLSVFDTYITVSSCTQFSTVLRMNFEYELLLIQTKMHGIKIPKYTGAKNDTKCS